MCLAWCWSCSHSRKGIQGEICPWDFPWETSILEALWPARKLDLNHFPWACLHQEWATQTGFPDFYISSVKLQDHTMPTCNENALKEFRLWEGNSGSGRRAMNVRWCPSSSPPSWTQRTDCPVVFLGLCPWLGHAGHLAGLVASPPSCTFAFSVPKRQHFLRTQFKENIPAATKRIPALRIMLFLLL